MYHHVFNTLLKIKVSSFNYGYCPIIEFLISRLPDQHTQEMVLSQRVMSNYPCKRWPAPATLLQRSLSPCSLQHSSIKWFQQQAGSTPPDQLEGTATAAPTSMRQGGTARMERVCPPQSAPHPSDLPSTQPWAPGLENRWANCRIGPWGSTYYGEASIVGLGR